MAATFVASPSISIRENASCRRRIPKRSKTGLDDFGSSLFMQGDKAGSCTEAAQAGSQRRYWLHTATIEDNASKPTTRHLPQHEAAYLRAAALVVELLHLLATEPSPYGASPPPYDHTDPPPEYSSTDSSACVHNVFCETAPTFVRTKDSDAYGSSKLEIMATIDWNDTTGVQGRGKAAKKAQKKAQQAKWADSGDEGAGGAAGDGGEDGAGGNDGASGGAGGAGGDDNGRGGDGGDDWNFGGKKSKKKGKKGKEEEENKNGQEDEDQKEEANANPLSWADDANGDVPMGDDWTSGFSTAKTKKKKGKKGDESATDPPPANAFHEISLDDTAPNLDFSFSGAGKGTKDTGSSFGAWGKTWDFNSAGNGATTDKKDDRNKDEKDTKHAKGDSSDFGDNNPWSFGGKAKGAAAKKKTISNGFDFGDFGAVDETDDFMLNGDLGETKVADNAWGFASINPKDDKKKKKGAKEEPAATFLPDPEPETKEDDIFGTWGTKTTTKAKKNKKGIEEEIPPPPPPVDAMPDPPAEENWSFGLGKKDKDKKKGKKGVLEDPVELKKDNTIEDTGEADLGFDWGFGGSKKDKPKKKGLISEVHDPVTSFDESAGLDADTGGADDMFGSTWGTGTKKKDKKTKKSTTGDQFLDLDAEPTGDTKTVTSDPPEDSWSAFGSAKDKKKAGKKGKKEEEPPAPMPAVLDPPADDADIWGTFGKKDKKTGKKNKVASAEPTIADPEPEPEPLQEEDSWGTFGLSAKDKKKKEKDAKKKGTEAVLPDLEPEPEPVVEEDSWGTFGLSAKDRKKKEKEIKRKPIEPVIPDPETEPEPEVQEDSWGTWGLSTKDKKAKEKEDKKLGKADVLEKASSRSVDKTSYPSPAEDDLWGSFGKTDKKKIGKKGRFAEEPPPPVPTPPAQGLTPEPGPMELPDFDDFGGDSWGLGASKSKTSVKKAGTLSKTVTSSSNNSKNVSTKPKLKDLDMYGGDDDDLLASSKDEEVKGGLLKSSKASMWGGFGSTPVTTAKSRLAREKEAKAKQAAEEEQARIEAEEAAAAEAEAKRIEEEEAAAAAAKKTSKSKASSKLTKTTAKTSDKSDDKKKKAKEEDDALLDLLDDPTPAKEDKKSSKISGTTTKSGERSKTPKTEEPEEEAKDDDYFGFDWAGKSSKKTAGKKEIGTKREIDNKGLTNGRQALVDLDNDLNFGTDYAKPAATSKTTSNSTMLKGRSTGTVADRIKAFETGSSAKKEEIGKSWKVDPRLTKEVAVEDVPSPKEEKKSSLLSKSKATTASTSKPSKKTSPIAEEKKSRDSVPGSFPGGFDDEDNLLDLDQFPAPVEKKSKTKSSIKEVKEDKKSTTKTKEKRKSITMDDFDLADEEPPKLPTPPPEEKKSAKKERAVVSRTGANTSWGFWGAAPTPKKSEKSPKSKDDADVSPPPAKKEKSASTGLSRSKSIKTPRESERELKKDAEKSSKSSGSEKAPKAKTSERPKTSSRGMTFSSFVSNGAPPSAMKTKSTRRDSTPGGSSRISSRRQSMDAGMISPPPEEFDGNDKAAKLMGMRPSKLGRNVSVKGKSKAAPDPYPIDDDDMVFIQEPKESTVKPSKTKSSKSKKEIKTKSPSPDDDVVMVDGLTSGGEPMITSGPDDMAFVDHPPLLKRSNTARRSGIFGSLFGASKVIKEDRPKSSRDRDLTDADEALPIRTKEKSSTKRKSTARGLDEGFTTEAAETDADAEARKAERRRQRDGKTSTGRDVEDADRAVRDKRKDRRDRDQLDVEPRRSKTRDSVRKDQEEAEAPREERRARRKEDIFAPSDKAGISAASAAKKEERRRLRAELEAQEAAKSGNDKKEKYAADPEDERRRRRDEARSSKKEKSSRKKSTVLMDEYHESRNGGGSLPIPPNKTSSWVHSQADDPPDLPPVVETIVDGEKPRSAEEEDAKRWKRESSRKSKYAGLTDVEIEERRRRRRSTTIDKSQGSDERRGKLRRRDTQNDEYEYDQGYGPLKSGIDGRPSQSKRQSFLGKFF